MSVLPRLRVPLLGLLLAVGVAGWAVAPVSSAARQARTEEVLTVSHLPVAPLAVQGSGIGAVRSFLVPIEVASPGPGSYYMTGTLTTTGLTSDGKREVRIANLVFVLGSPANQLVVGGAATTYPIDGTTLPVGAKAIRPIIGGSGKYSLAQGWLVSINRGDAGWTHEFHFRRV